VLSAKRSRGAPLRREGEPGVDFEETLDSMQGALVVGGLVVGLFYVMRLTGVFPHPLDHLIGIACWIALVVIFGLRCLWEQGQGLFPVRWGTVLSLALAGVAALGLLIEVAVATNPVHTENQPHRIFSTE
jgi:hypothetical protein